MENQKAAEILEERFLDGYIMGLYTGNWRRYACAGSIRAYN